MKIKVWCAIAKRYKLTVYIGWIVLGQSLQLYVHMNIYIK